jgi:hypothetical protein
MKAREPHLTDEGQTKVRKRQTESVNDKYPESKWSKAG